MYDRFEKLNRETHEYNIRNVSHHNLRSQFLGASGNRQNGYYYSPSCSTSKPASTGWYDGAGRYHER
jgi:hypothetical protein